ncbi:ParB N-terminal domain-containing protein [Ekhidna sp.]
MNNTQLELDYNPILGFKLLKHSELKPHERVVTERFSKLTDYLKSLSPYVIIPSILVNIEDNVIIDGHHRFHALVSLGFEKVPVTYINYQLDMIVTDLEGNKVLKSEILEAGNSGNLLEPKTSFHHVRDKNEGFHPIILLSTLYSEINSLHAHSTEV